MKHLANAATVLDYDWSVPATQHRWGLKQPGVKYTKEIPREEKERIAPAQHVEFRRPNARVSDHANDAVGNVQTNAYTASLHSPLGCAEST